MIISYRKNFIFIHIYKTAGTSIFSIFSKYGKFSSLFSEVWPTRFFVKSINVLFNLDNYGNSWINGVQKHASCKEIQKYVGKEFFSKSYKFSFVRNPYDLQYSLWCYEKKSRTHRNFKEANKISFEEFIDKQILSNAPCQVDFLKLDGKISIDNIGYFEHFNKSINFISHRLGLPIEEIPKLNSSNRKKISLEEVYSKELAEIVYKHFREDFDVLGYSRDLSRLKPIRANKLGVIK